MVSMSPRTKLGSGPCTATGTGVDGGGKGAGKCGGGNGIGGAGWITGAGCRVAISWHRIQNGSHPGILLQRQLEFAVRYVGRKRLCARVDGGECCLRLCAGVDRGE